MSSVLYDAIGPRGRRNITLWTIIGAVLVAAVLGVALIRLAAHGQLESARWEVYTMPVFYRLLFEGLVKTLQAALAAMVLAIVVGAVLAIGRLSERWWVRAPTRVWVEFFRGFPLLLLIFFMFLGAPVLLGVNLSAFQALVIALTLYNGAVIAEVFRAGILSLPKGQTEAAYAVGLRRFQALQLILIPQAIRRMLPALVSQLVTLLKDTSLGFVIAYDELLRRGQTAVEFLGGRFSLPVYVAVAVLYIAMNLSLSRFAVWLDKRTQRQIGETVHLRAADEAA
jgi:glutamate transport system permease protein